MVSLTVPFSRLLQRAQGLSLRRTTTVLCGASYRAPGKGSARVRRPGHRSPRLRRAMTQPTRSRAPSARKCSKRGLCSSSTSACTWRIPSRARTVGQSSAGVPLAVTTSRSFTSLTRCPRPGNRCDLGGGAAQRVIYLLQAVLSFFSSMCVTLGAPIWAMLVHHGILVMLQPCFRYFLGFFVCEVLMFF